MSVAAGRKKGKSELVEQTRRSLGQGLGVLVTLEIPHKHDKKKHHRKHDDREVMSFSIGTTRR